MSIEDRSTGQIFDNCQVEVDFSPRLPLDSRWRVIINAARPGTGGSITATFQNQIKGVWVDNLYPKPSGRTITLRTYDTLIVGDSDGSREFCGR